MDYRKHRVILEIVKRLRAQGSWTGKTHVQKAMFLLAARQPDAVPFEFTLYKHGPYSFDIEQELLQMRSYDALNWAPVMGYGVQINPGSSASQVESAYKLTDEESRAIDIVCTFVGSKAVKDLERLATAAWIRTRENIEDENLLSERLHELKPHITIPDALEANRSVQILLQPLA